MGFYADHVLPRLLDLAMRNKYASRLRAVWIPKARGEVLEVGIGSGLNLPFYSEEVQHVYGVDPSIKLQQMAQVRAAAGKLAVDFLLQSAEKTVALPDSSIDTAVCTWTLCSIPDPLPALREVRRVLKPDGVFIFLEHGRAPEPSVTAWQDRLTPPWKKIAGGCHLNRKIDQLIVDAGLRITDLKNEYLPGPRPMTYTYEGCAKQVI